MADIVLGTAGHIDHGKTTLVKGLTGIETDTTNEEKQRGLSINLGFAYLDLPNHQRVGIVDVPGHERFIKNMVAGLPGIDLVLLVIDANEGIMPQTKEHLDIMTLLGIKNYLIVLTKCDTVDPELLELVRDDIHEQLAGTTLADAPLIETDAVSGKGLDELKETVQQFVAAQPDVPVYGPGRLNVDRSFSVKGFGTIVTGTLLDGIVAVGDEVTIFPNGKSAKIRNIQVHEENQKTASAGQRTALNLANVSTEDVKRGDVLTNGETLETTWMLDVKVSCLKDSPIGIDLWNRVRVLIGTREVFARVVPIGTESVQPGDEGFIQLRLEEQVAVKAGDYFILRTYSPVMTIGGGQVLDAAPVKHRRFKQDVLDSLKVKDEGTLDYLILDFLLHQKNALVSFKEIDTYFGQDAAELQTILADLSDKQEVIKLNNERWMSQKRLIMVKTKMIGYLEQYHKKYRLRKGMPIEEFRSKLQSDLSNKEITDILTYLKDKHQLVVTNQYVALPDFEVIFNKYQLVAQEKIETALKKSGYMPIKKEELIELDKNAVSVLEALEGESVISLTFEYVISKDVLVHAIEEVRQFIHENGKMTLANFRDMTQSSRKASMLILEYLDGQHITERVENTRILVEKKS
ncbi:selenocysteine-specific translation elongation factor [Vagococcus vulneris]|uniref:Selenocysteine-specific elongation factor n=1 Tax=Vagococcus vulneris TaxID=1977869 RepID=A0A429ZXJ2_9ENTE|nr:selenocysteine-specific translation elongation factor [Vagococcus vulneris]RST98593.1 selenocysteine-specific translation elongation factor [Vagococcus vulneris]